MISLGIECLVFEKESASAKENILFLDEPDVHLHPDLQVRLCHFIRDLSFPLNITQPTPDLHLCLKVAIQNSHILVIICLFKFSQGDLYELH